MKITDTASGWLKIEDHGGISVLKTFDCGQCFRFDSTPDGNFDHRADGVAFGRKVSFAEKGEELYIKCSREDFDNIWYRYLCLDTDYNAIDTRIINSLPDSDRPHMKLAAETGRGIRILRQEPWEALCSFIISQNNKGFKKPHGYKNKEHP